MTQRVGSRDGILFREKADGSSGYWKEYPIAPNVFKIKGGVPTWKDPDATSVGGWILDDAGEELTFTTHIDQEWDEVSNILVKIYFEINVAGGAGTDTVDLKVDTFLKGEDEAVTRNQTLEDAKIVGTAAQFTLFELELQIIFNDGANPVRKGDVVTMVLNLETDTSEIDNVTINYGELLYQTLTPGLLRD